MNEVWEDVKDFEGLYKVSNLGRVKRLQRKYPQGYSLKEKIIKPYKSSTGYLTICLSKYNKKKQKKLHRLIAKSFIPNLLNKPYINHIDGNKENNGIENLEWCTGSENMQHAYNTGLNFNNPNPWFKPKKVEQYTKNGLSLVGNYASISEANRKTGINIAHISECCNKKKHFNSAGGYVWKFAS